MQHHRGRLVDHVHLRARNLEATKRFYKAVLAALGMPVGSESADHMRPDPGVGRFLTNLAIQAKIGP